MAHSAPNVWFAALGAGLLLWFSTSCSIDGNSVNKADEYSLPEYRLADFREANEQCAAYFIEGDVRVDTEQSLDRFAATIDTSFAQSGTDGVYAADLPGDRRVWVTLEYEVMAVFRFLWNDQVYEQRKAIANMEQDVRELEPSFFVSVTSMTEVDVIEGEWGEVHVSPKEIGSIHRYRLLSDSEDNYNESVSYHCNSPLGNYFYTAHYLSSEKPLRRPEYPNQIITGYTLGTRSLYLILNCEGSKCGVHIVEEDERRTEAFTNDSESFLGGTFAPALNAENALIPGAQRFFSLPFTSNTAELAPSQAE